MKRKATSHCGQPPPRTQSGDFGHIQLGRQPRNHALDPRDDVLRLVRARCGDAVANQATESSIPPKAA
jgi:hypothetical protein